MYFQPAATVILPELLTYEPVVSVPAFAIFLDFLITKSVSLTSPSCSCDLTHALPLHRYEPLFAAVASFVTLANWPTKIPLTAVSNALVS